MTVLILEGIATSGKSTIISGLEKALAGRKVRVAGEDTTHIPIMQATEETHVDFFKELIARLIAEDPEVLILDRLYITQAFRAKVSLEPYKEIEQLLGNHHATTIFLKVDENAIAARIQKATEHRDAKWGDYVKTKGRSIEVAATYYIAQQRNQLKLLEQSQLPYKIFDTTTHDYETIVSHIKSTFDNLS